MHERYLKRRRKWSDPDRPWVQFEGGGKRTYRRLKTEAELAMDKSGEKLREFRRQILHDYIRNELFGRPIDIKARVKELRDQGEIINLD